MTAARGGAGELYPRHRDRLPEADTREIAVPHRRFRQQHTQRLAAVIDPRRLAEAERGKVIVKSRSPQCERDIRKAGVTAVVERVGERLVAVLAVCVVAPALYRRAVHRPRAAAGKYVARRKGVAVSPEGFLDVRRPR